MGQAHGIHLLLVPYILGLSIETDVRGHMLCKYGLNKLEGCRRIVIFQTKPSYDEFGAIVDEPHEAYLTISLDYIFLIDTELINP